MLEAVRKDKNSKKILGVDYGRFRGMDVDEKIQRVESLRAQTFMKFHAE